MADYKDFSLWLDNVLENGIPEITAALCFNLYEESVGDHTWAAQAAFCEKFDSEDYTGGWACYAQLVDEMYIWDSDEDWQCAEKTAASLIEEYLKVGKFRNELLELQGVAYGFVDGDINLVHINQTVSSQKNDYRHYDPEKSKELVKMKANETLQQILNKINAEKNGME